MFGEKKPSVRGLQRSRKRAALRAKGGITKKRGHTKYGAADVQAVLLFVLRNRVCEFVSCSIFMFSFLLQAVAFMAMNPELGLRQVERVCAPSRSCLNDWQRM